MIKDMERLQVFPAVEVVEEFEERALKKPFNGFSSSLNSFGTYNSVMIFQMLYDVSHI